MQDSTELKKPLRVTFAGEEGIDAGGLTAEFFLLLTNKIFQPEYGMFEVDEDSQLAWPNPATFDSAEEFRLLGIVLGLAVYHMATIALPIPLALYKRLIGVRYHSIGGKPLNMAQALQ